ncbi:putative endosulphine [Medicago truncatula]|uniref:Putative endosulphine n=1 Tax=Medicago truncatula TaxID=3880 RepID=G7I7R2_MEDTR|nr:uncharacterized protein LOC11414593 [Medicago truncatula]AES59764.1 cAMP-regulated phosphoprotein-like protein [Medicago truncatula]RHN77626.1 putative endosulphine [Medicago truncatula]
MSDGNNVADDVKKHELDENNSLKKVCDQEDTNNGNSMPLTQHEEDDGKKHELNEDSLNKDIINNEKSKPKYGRLAKKPPLISKGRAYFDSADWALGKHGAQLRPKLQPTHKEVLSRRSTYAPSGDSQE